MPSPLYKNTYARLYNRDSFEYLFSTIPIHPAIYKRLKLNSVMNSFITKTAMLVLFLLAVTCAWAAVTMVFQVSLINILLGILAAFFLLRAFELADKVNKLGPYAEEDEAPVKPKPMGPNKPGPRFGEGTPDDDSDEVPEED